MDLLTQVYPEYPWLPWKFTGFSTKNLVTNPQKRQVFIEWMANQLNIKELNDWHKIKAEVNFL